MIILNDSKNTIHLEDVDEYISPSDQPEEISPDRLKKSRSLRNCILNGTIKVVEFDPKERIESSLMYLLNKMASAKSETVVTTEPESETEPDVVEATLKEVSDDIEVRIHGLFYDASGYAKVNRNLALCLHKSGIKVKVDPKKGQNQLNEDELRNLVVLERTPISKRNHIVIDSIIPSFSEFSSAKYKILYTTIESYTVQDQFLAACQNYEEIWLTSEWSASILRKYLPDRPIYAICTGADPNIYTEEGDRFDFKPNIKSFVFLSVFAWNYRKGPDVLCKAYFDEFSQDDDVSLLIMSRYQSGRTRHHREKIRLDIDKYMEGFPNKDMPHIVRFNQMLPENDMPKLYRAADAFILTTRGEGGNLPALEASLCGLPLIMTNCSGQQGYLRPDNSYLIDVDRIAPVQPGQMHLHYWDGHEFPQLTSQGVHDQVKQHMRHVYENYDEAKKRNRKMQQLIHQDFTWTHTANAAIERLKEINKKLKG